MWSKKAGCQGTPAGVVEEASAARAQRPARVTNRASKKLQTRAQLRAGKAGRYVGIRREWFGARMSERAAEVGCKGADGDCLCLNNNEVAGEARGVQRQCDMQRMGRQELVFRSGERQRVLSGSLSLCLLELRACQSERRDGRREMEMEVEMEMSSRRDRQARKRRAWRKSKCAVELGAAVVARLDLRSMR